MTIDSAWDIQAGLYAYLTATSAVTDLLADGADSILDHVPGGTAFPYVVLGEMSAKPLDTQMFSGSDVAVILHVFSRGRGLQETKNILAALHTALHNATPSIPNQNLILCQHTQTDAILESDGLTRHGTIRFRIITEPV